MNSTFPPIVSERILLVSEPGVDGVFRHVEGLAHFLLSRGHEVDFAYSARRGGADLDALVRCVEAAGGATMNLAVGNEPGPRDVPAWRKLNRLVRERQPSVIHAHSSKAGALVRLLPSVGDARLFYTPHAYYGLRPGTHWRGRFYNRLERILGQRGVTINVSESEAGFAATVLAIDASVRMTIPNGVDLAKFRPPDRAERGAARAALGLREDTLVLGSVARLCHQKDPHTLYRAFAAARAAGADVHLVHVGTGPEPAFAQGLLSADVQPHVTRVAQMPTRLLYHAVDGLIVTSRYEGLSLVVLEALACGLPLLLSDVPGNDDILRRRPSQAWAFRAGDVAQAAECIGAWASQARSAAPNNHRELARRFYDATQNFARIERAYGRLSAIAPTLIGALQPDFAL